MAASITRWRDQDRKVKQDKYGMTDLWDPARRVGSVWLLSRRQP